MAQDRRELDRPPAAQGALLARPPFSLFARPLLSKASVFPKIPALRIVADRARLADNALTVHVHPSPETSEELVHFRFVDGIGENPTPLVELFDIIRRALWSDDAVVFEELAEATVFALQVRD